MRAPPSQLKQTVVALLYVAATFSPTAGSVLKEDLPPMDGLQNAEEVSDEVLGNMRGKFVGGGQIVNFGVQMVSTWQNTQGQILAAAANLNVNIANASQPVVQFVPHLTIVEAVAPTTPVPPAALQSAGGNGISNVSGVAQSIQIAGDGNRIGNDASITITNAPPPPPLPAPSGGPQTATLTSPTTGATVSASVQGNGLSVGISVPNIGRTLQQIKGAAASGGGIVQVVQAAADLQWIQNRMNIYVNLQSAGPGAAPTGINSALNSLRGLRPMGAY
jgi:hypothetical protein